MSSEEKKINTNISSSSINENNTLAEMDKPLVLNEGYNPKNNINNEDEDEDEELFKLLEEKNVPIVTEAIIKEAEKTLVLKKQ